MLCFSDLAVLAGAWERSRQEFDDELRTLCKRLELRKQEYTRECRKLAGRSARVERIFLRIWGVDDSHLEGRIPKTRERASPNTGDARVTRCDDLAIETEEREEMERAIAAIANTIRDSPLTSDRAEDSALERDRYTVFAPLASAYWVEHTSTGFRHAIWKMETFNHVAPISIRALQFLGNITDAHVKECKTQMITMPTGRRSWRRQKSDCDVFLHLKYTSRVMEPLSIRKMINETLARIIGDDTATWLERMMIEWTYNASIASRLCKPVEVFCDFNVAQWMEIYDPEQCPCRTRRYADMRSPASLNLLQSEGHTHVITIDSSVTDNPLMQGIMNSGLNHIPCMALDIDVAESEVGEFLDRLMARVMELQELTASTRSFLRRVILKKARAKMSRYKEQHRHVPAEPFERELEFLTGRFLICPTDKAPNTPVFVCKNFIRKLAFQRLSGPEFASIAAPPAAVVAQIQELCANLPERIFSVFTADITKCFETIPTDNSEDGLPAAVRFYVQSAMQVRRERSSCHTIQIRVGDGGKLWPSWVSDRQIEGMGTMLFGEKDICWLSDWCIADSVLRMGDYVWRQVRGIPMGLACSPIWCDIYFFKYAMMRLADTGNAHLIPYFSDTFSYVDDLGAINNTIIRDFMKKEGREADDPCWIYPAEYIELKENTEVIVDGGGCKANFLSMTITITSPEAGTFITSKHDKREGLGFTPCRYVKYRSNRYTKQALQVVTAQVAQILLLCSEPHDAASEINKVVTTMMGNGFAKDAC
ncbi:hypothetical protein CBR_g38026 [Chara braunii]|uniref:Reverse transcriptase domain-containing protein n=1 Tax=Chara braunii TaxID=69332 RepID=A0A388K0C4_CHABU|nr:hypothetical protein CBR_g38026 [Chara braunii]|eukprot:GBG63403.1 hypothetical protein CBR_g38026 [Chara braunii]